MKYWNLEHEKFEIFEDYINKTRSLRESLGERGGGLSSWTACARGS